MESEFHKVENLLRACAANIKHCRKVIIRTAALVDRAKKRIEFSENNLRTKNVWSLKQPIGHAVGRVFFPVGAPTTTGKFNEAKHVSSD